ncbi:MAG: hypothetical protein LBV03_09475 [Fusobacteriales bacterium]|jgi:hypothetical protein|nr:hypothetical protein [Fusobacteriales bacterium]
MKNLDYDVKIYCYVMIETLLKNLKGSGELIKELESLKEQYCKNMIN